ncbi:MAG TPA: hypothetical protein VFF54_04830 [Thermodesulfobacteriota bacterium]|nr:hypothetical protein [Thermodesulfobacteriota bacterium]
MRFFPPQADARIKALRFRLGRFPGRFAFCLFCLAALFAYSCAGGGVKKPSSYNDELERLTRRGRIYEGLDARLHIYAVYKSETFRRAYIDEYASRYALSDELREVLLKFELESGEKYNEFLISAYTPLDEWNDFDDKEPTWRMYLSDKSGVRLEPLEIKRLDAKDPLYREFYPFIDYWSYVYSVRFPKYGADVDHPVGGADSEYLTLAVTGIKGAGVLKWILLEKD